MDRHAALPDSRRRYSPERSAAFRTWAMMGGDMLAGDADMARLVFLRDGREHRVTVTFGLRGGG